MDKKYRLLVLCALILVLCLVGVVSGETWYVDDDGRANFTRIQDAIDNATAGDTIIVLDGKYVENINVDKSLTILSVNGADLTIIQAANLSDYVFEVRANYVTISGFTVRNATLKSGIYLQRYVEHCTIFDNRAMNNEYGIFLDQFNTNNTIIRNIVSNNKGGIRSEYSSNDTFIANIISYNEWGIHLYYSDYTAVMNNTVVNNTGTSMYSSGIYVYPYSDNNTIVGNIVRDNKNGIYVWKSILRDVLRFMAYFEHQKFLPCPNVICDALSHARSSFYVLVTLLRFYRQRGINPDQVVVALIHV
jgi:nitrous oxidase accessory protein